MHIKMISCIFFFGFLATPVAGADMRLRQSVEYGSERGASAKNIRDEIFAANNQIRGSIVGARVDYLEKSGSTKLDSETGWVPGLEASASVMQNWGVENLYLFGQFKWLNGRSKYVGSYMNGSYGDLVQHDGATVYETEFRIGKGFHLVDEAMLTPYVGAGTRYWTRVLSGPGGYREDYRHAYIGAGALLQIALVDRLVLGLDGLIGRSFRAEMATTPTLGGAAIPPDTYKLGGATVYNAGLALDYAVHDHFHVNAGVDYAGFKYGHSPVSAQGYYEPDSKTDEVTLKFGLGYAF